MTWWSRKIRWATVLSFGHCRIRHEREAPFAVRSTDPFTGATVVRPPPADVSSGAASAALERITPIESESPSLAGP
jgi:hypothetical protein